MTKVQDALEKLVVLTSEEMYQLVKVLPLLPLSTLVATGSAVIYEALLEASGDKVIIQ